jgi:hypothetical protein
MQECAICWRPETKRSFGVQKDEILTYSVANSVEILVSLATDVHTGFREEEGTLADEDNALVS